MQGTLTPEQISSYQSKMSPATPSSTVPAPQTPAGSTSNGLLTPDQISQYKTKMASAGIGSPQNIQKNASSDWGAFDAAMKQQTTSQTNSIGEIPNVGSQVKDIASTASEGAQQFGTGFQQVLSSKIGDLGSPTDWSSLGRGILNMAAGGINTAFSPITGTIKTLSNTPGIKQAVGLVKSSVINPSANAISNIPALQQFMTQFPHADEVTANLITIGLALAGGEKAPEIKAAVEKGSNAVSDMLPKTPEVTPSVDIQQKSADLQSLKEKISPKPTTQEAKLAMKQGRLVRGQEPGIFKEGTPDKVLTSDQQMKTIQTIDQLIPDHASMNEPQLYTALGEKITETAKGLQPAMEKTPITPDTVQKITDDMKALKSKLMEEAPADQEANVAKREEKFESFVQKSKSENMNDLWNTAKDYDDSIPNNVKKANDLSPESLQLQKSEWLQRRAILRSAINDTKNGLGATSQKAFSDMTNLYDAQSGILSKAKINVKGAPSKLNKFLNTTTGRVVKMGAEAAGAGTIIKGANLIP